MTLRILSIHAVWTLAAVMLLAGCDGSSSSSDGGKETPTATKASDSHDHGEGGHQDEHQGPHGGHVLEIGRGHQFHAEVVLDDDEKSVTIYLLDGKLQAVSDPVESVAVNLVVDGKPKSFELSKGADGGYRAASKELFEAHHDKGASGTLRVVINGKPFTAKLESHDHSDHDHSGHDHSDHDH